MMRRATRSGRQASMLSRVPCSAIHSPTSARAFARVMVEVRGAQMAQPAEAEQLVRPFVRRRLDLERRASVADHDLAREGEAPRIDLARAGRVGGAQVLRRDQQAIRHGGRKTPTQHRMRVEPAHARAQSAPRREGGQSGPIREPAGQSAYPSESAGGPAENRWSISGESPRAATSTRADTGSPQWEIDRHDESSVTRKEAQSGPTMGKFNVMMLRPAPAARRRSRRARSCADRNHSNDWERA